MENFKNINIEKMNDELFDIIYSASNIEKRYSGINEHNIVLWMQEKINGIGQEDLKKIILKFKNRNQKLNNFEKFTLLLNQAYEEAIKQLVISIKNNNDDEFYKNIKQNFLFLELTKRREVDEKVEKIKNRINQIKQKKTSLEKVQKDGDLKEQDKNLKFLDFYNNFLQNSFAETYQEVPEYKEEIFFINYLKEIIKQQEQNITQAQNQENENINDLINVLMKDDECKRKFLKSFMNKHYEKLYYKNFQDYLKNKIFIDKNHPETRIVNKILNKVYNINYQSENVIDKEGQSLNQIQDTNIVITKKAKTLIEKLKNFITKNKNEFSAQKHYKNFNKKLDNFLNQIDEDKANYHYLGKIIQELSNSCLTNEHGFVVKTKERLMMEDELINIFIKKISKREDSGEIFKKLQEAQINGHFDFYYPFKDYILMEEEKHFALFTLSEFLLRTQDNQNLNSTLENKYLNVFNFSDVLFAIKEKIAEEVILEMRAEFINSYLGEMNNDVLNILTNQQKHLIEPFELLKNLNDETNVEYLKNKIFQTTKDFKETILSLRKMNEPTNFEIEKFKILKKEMGITSTHHWRFLEYEKNLNKFKKNNNYVISNKDILNDVMSCYSKLIILNYLVNHFDENDDKQKNISVSSLKQHIKENEDLQIIHDEITKIKLKDCVLNKQDFKNLIEKFDEKNENLNLNIIEQQLTSRLIIEDCVPKMQCEKEIIKFSELTKLCDFNEEKIQESLEKLKYGYNLSDLVKEEEEENKKQKEERNGEYGAYDHLFYSQNNNIERNEEPSKNLEEKIESRMSDFNSQSNYNYSYGGSSSNSDSSSSSSSD